MPDQRELRVLVIGSSVAFMTTPQRNGRHDGPYAERLDAELQSLGISSRTTMHCQWHGMVHEARRLHERHRDTMADVIIINLGMGECHPRLMPTWLHRHFMTWDFGSRASQVAYRKHLAPLLWRPLRSWQRVGSKLVGQHTHRLSPGRFDREMSRMIKDLRMDLAPLILVLDLDPANDRLEHWLPGMRKRVERYNTILRSVVQATASPEVRLVNTSSIVHELGFETALPDGYHRSSLGHHHVAMLLAQEIAPWAKEQFA